MKKQTSVSQLRNADLFDANDDFTGFARTNKHRRVKKEKKKSKKLYQILVHGSYKSFYLFQNDWEQPYYSSDGEVRHHAEMRWWHLYRNAYKRYWKKCGHRHERRIYKAMLTKDPHEDIIVSSKKWYFSNIWDID